MMAIFHARRHVRRILASLLLGLGCGPTTAPKPAPPVDHSPPGGVVDVDPGGGLPETPPTVAASDGPLAPSDPVRYEPPDTGVAARQAWARKQWPSLASVRFDSLSDELLAWVPAGGELEVYIAGIPHAKPCSLAILRRSAEAPPPGAEAFSPVQMQLRIIVGRRRVNGSLQREYRAASAGFELLVEDADGKERREPSGEWVEFQGTATGSPPERFGVLSHVDARVARFAGQRLRLEIGCDTWGDLPCDSGRDRVCNLCRTLYVEPIEYETRGYGRGRWSPPPKPTDPPRCTDPCPKFEHPDADRVANVFAPWPIWSLPDPTTGPALYRSKKTCLRHEKP